MKIKGLESLLKDLRKLKVKAEEKSLKEQEKNSKKFITFKGYECYTHDDIDNVYRYDECTNSECDKAHDRLDKKLSCDVFGTTATDIYLDVLDNMILNISLELEEEKFKRLPYDEQKKILEERNRDAGVEF